MTKFVWIDGKIVEWENAKIHVMTHALHYGTSVFEGIRGYYNGEYMLIFRLREHVKRLLDSSKILGLKLKYSLEDIEKAIIDTVKANNFKENIYIRPIAFVSSQTIQLDIRNLDTSLAIIIFPFGKYLKEGIRVKIVSWRRVHNTMLPVMAKIGGIYVNSVLALREARENGYDEALLMDINGYVVEGSGENLFIVRNEKIYTPPTNNSILEGITRDSVIKILKDMGYEVIEKPLVREELYTADEIFLTGTAAEITPVIEVDNIKIGIGNITKKLIEEFNNIVYGKNKKYEKWLTKVIL